MINESTTEKKFRHEFKYLCADTQLVILRNRLMGLMKKDSHVGENGVYHIKSLYFDSLPALAKKLQILRLTTGMIPKIIVEYERTPYVYKNGNVRITLDRNITSSSQINKFFCTDAPKRPILPNGMQLLEVKYDEYLPDHIFHALMLDNMQRTNFSKYYLCRKYSI